MLNELGILTPQRARVARPRVSFMSRRRLMLGRLAGATLILLLAWSGTAQALGLGDIRLESALNEPFRAEIELLSVTPEELEGLTVQLAPTETFQRYGIDRPPFLSGFRFEIRQLSGDRGVVRITSREPVTEPFVTFLAEARKVTNGSVTGSREVIRTTPRSPDSCRISNRNPLRNGG